MWPNPQETADLVTFAEEIFNGKLHFLCSVRSVFRSGRSQMFFKICALKSFAMFTRKLLCWSLQLYIFFIRDSGCFLVNFSKFFTTILRNICERLLLHDTAKMSLGYFWHFFTIIFIFNDTLVENHCIYMDFVCESRPR